jgi:hypothetical protein
MVLPLALQGQGQVQAQGHVEIRKRQTPRNNLTALLAVITILTIAALLVSVSTRAATATTRTTIWQDQEDEHEHEKDHDHHHRRLSEEQQQHEQQHEQQKLASPLKILYTVTTLAEYDSGQRATSRGFDRLQELLIPVVKEGVESMISFGYHVDVYLVCHYQLKPERLALVRNALPESVHLRVWDDATPIGYDTGKEPSPFAKVLVRTISLARQHRFVVKDNLFDYDFFLNFEDDMVVKGHHVQQYLEMTQELYRLRALAPETITTTTTNNNNNDPNNNFFGEMTKSQLKRVFPGLIRVEVLLDEDKYGTQTELDPVPVTDRPRVDPQPCCYMSNHSSSSNNNNNSSSSSVTDKGRPASPDSDKLFLWESSIIAMGVRQMPLESKLGWVLMQRGPTNANAKVSEPQQQITKTTTTAIGDYWSGTDGYFAGQQKRGRTTRPRPGDFANINNQGGWMATRQQIWEWHTDICLGGFLPPYEPPHYRFDGLDLRNVEYWSGGLHLVTTRHACNMQRIISLEPENFARQLLYHSSNNKQRQLTNKKHLFTKVNDFLGQLNTVRNNAIQKMLEQKGG